MSEHISIRGGRVIDPAGQIDEYTDVHIAEGRIAALGPAPVGFAADRVIAADGQVVCPGLVDVSVRLREPGDEHKATVASEAAAAVSAGITTVCTPPDTLPVTDTPAVVELIHQRTEEAGKARVVTIGALTQGLEGKQLSEMAALRTAGVVGVGNAGRPLANTLVMRRALEYAATQDLTVFLTPEDTRLRNCGCVHEGPVGTRLGLPGIPEAAETSAVALGLVLSEQTGVRLHFCRLSTARAARMIARAQYDGLPVTADVAVHQLYLTEHDLGRFDSLCHVRPPLRSTADRNGLRTGVARGTVCAICSDHQPHEADAKLAPFPSTAPGISGLETLLPLTLKLVDDGLMALPDALARVTSQPAGVLGVEAGSLAVGNAADICVFDPQHEWVLNAAQLVSRGHNTPFLGWRLQGRATCTLVGGRVVHTLG